MPAKVPNAAGSPGPFDRNTPSGSNAMVFSAEKEAGTTVTVAIWAKERSIVSLTPKS